MIQAMTCLGTCKVQSLAAIPSAKGESGTATADRTNATQGETKSLIFHLLAVEPFSALALILPLTRRGTQGACDVAGCPNVAVFAGSAENGGRRYLLIGGGS